MKTVFKLRYVLIVVICFGVLLLFFNSDPGEKKWIREKSPDYSWELIINYKEASLFGSHRINVYYKKSNWFIKKEKLFQTRLSNDGKALSESNCEINWKDNSIVRLVLKGEEQMDDVYIIDISQKEKVRHIGN